MKWKPHIHTVITLSSTSRDDFRSDMIMDTWDQTNYSFIEQKWDKQKKNENDVSVMGNR